VVFKIRKSIPLEAVLVVVFMIVLMFLWRMLPLDVFHTVGNLSGAPPVAIILACIAVLLTYSMALLCFNRYAPPMFQHTQNVIMLWATFIMALGVVFVLVAVPMMHEANQAYNELFRLCDSGQRTKTLYQSWQSLMLLRRQPFCSGSLSVESCSGYQKTVPAQVLQYMENSFKCSGFCYQPGTIANLTGSVPTLFSRANFEASCDGSAARDMKQFATAAAEQVFFEGLILVAISATIGLAQMCALFKLAGDYDTTDYVEQAVNRNYGTLRHQAGKAPPQ